MRHNQPSNRIKALLISATAVCTLQVSASMAAAVQQSSGVSTSADDAALRQQASRYTQAFAAGDAKTIANMWSADGTYTTPDGVHLRGRDAIERFFAGGFRDGGAHPLAIAIESIKFPSPGVALEQGTCSILEGPDAGETTRYTAVHTKDANGAWLISSVTETTAPRHATTTLNDLSWLVGNWTAKGPKGSMRFTADWAVNKKFIHCRYTDPANPNNEHDQMIGINPRSHRITSWHFDGTGGYGFGTWDKQGPTWFESARGVEPDGVSSSGTYVITKVDADNFTWRATGRRVAKATIADTQPITVTRDR
jgi:uncharacterized protein (TIGR02246 family)